MNEGVPQKFSTPEEEISFLRQQIAEREQELLGRSAGVDAADVETLGREQIKEYVSFTPRMILDPTFELKGEELAQSVEVVATAHDPVNEILSIAAEKGIKNALTVLEKTTNAYVIDEVHRKLVEQIRNGAQIADLKEGVPPWHVLHMTLYEVTLPAHKAVDGREFQLSELVETMEQLLMGLRTIGSATAGKHFVFEVAVSKDSPHIVFYIAVPNEFVTLFEKQTLSLFPHATLTAQPHDYNIFVDGGHTIISEVALKKHPIYPLLTHEDFVTDPLSVMINALSRVGHDTCGAAIQFVVRDPVNKYRKKYQRIIKDVQNGLKPEEAISRSTIIGDVIASLGEFVSSNKKDKDDSESAREINNEAIELFQKKINSELYEVNVRLVVSATEKSLAEQVMAELKSAFNQFDTPTSNRIVFKNKTGSDLRAAEKAFSFRQINTSSLFAISADELATMIHFPGDGMASPSEFKQSYSKTAAAPADMPEEGTLLGVNTHRNIDKNILITDEDRLRHFYIIGQTGTGKTTLMKNMIVQDILRGDGVCLIDPHGTDIDDVLGAVPPEREKDVIYFDPSRMERAIGLNMLEYDPAKPEQMTFVVNEMLSIFQKLYGANPESMGPMFEQYFRNATMLVMEDPASGCTLMDISRVMVDAQYRRYKMERARNPVTVQFWRDIAGKAGGEASLENIVPYIVSKTDPLTSNDYLRPIIGQQHSAFNFRKIMDDRKILLVNLAKGKIGEINANLIGMIIVGKFLMAALSRVDDPTKGYPPFYLHMDEFQNVTTNSISAILSEARKYKLGLTIAHQFIAQLQPNIKDAVFGNVGSKAAFRVGPDDAQFLEQEFAPQFSSSDLMSVPNRIAFMKILSKGVPTPPFSMGTLAPAMADLNKIERLITQSNARYGRPREEVEEEIRVRYQRPAPVVPPAPTLR